MPATIETMKAPRERKWECKQCHNLIAENETVAYHLVEGILYGWCETCFRERGKPAAELAA